MSNQPPPPSRTGSVAPQNAGMPPQQQQQGAPPPQQQQQQPSQQNLNQIVRSFFLFPSIFSPEITCEITGAHVMKSAVRRVEPWNERYSDLSGSIHFSNTQSLALVRTSRNYPVVLLYSCPALSRYPMLHIKSGGGNDLIDNTVSTSRQYPMASGCTAPRR